MKSRSLSNFVDLFFGNRIQDLRSNNRLNMFKQVIYNCLRSVQNPLNPRNPGFGNNIINNALYCINVKTQTNWDNYNSQNVFNTHFKFNSIFGNLAFHHMQTYFDPQMDYDFDSPYPVFNKPGGFDIPHYPHNNYPNNNYPNNNYPQNNMPQTPAPSSQPFPSNQQQIVNIHEPLLSKDSPQDNYQDVKDINRQQIINRLSENPHSKVALQKFVRNKPIERNDDQIELSARDFENMQQSDIFRSLIRYFEINSPDVQ